MDYNDSFNWKKSPQRAGQPYPGRGEIRQCGSAIDRKKVGKSVLCFGRPARALNGREEAFVPAHWTTFALFHYHHQHAIDG